QATQGHSTGGGAVAVVVGNHAKFFVRGPSAFARLIMFATLSLLLIASDARFSYLSEVRQSAVSLLSPFQWLANRPVVLYNDLSDFFTSQANLRAEVKRLNSQN
ncbi:MAG: hypothetical protein RLZZ351_982, partial [Pseudomonadota bacterium]